MTYAGSSELAEVRHFEDDARARLVAVRALLVDKNALALTLRDLEDRVSAVRASPYRSDDLRDLERKLEEARDARSTRAVLRIEEARLLGELERARKHLARRGVHTVALPMLDNVNVAAPCDVSWADMKGDSDVRLCTQCDKQVYNLSMMTREEADAVLFAGRETSMCVRLHRRADGTVLTADCPVGARRRRFWRRTTGVAAAGLIAAALGLAYASFTCNVRVAASQGAVSSF